LKKKNELKLIKWCHYFKALPDLIAVFMDSVVFAGRPVAPFCL